MHISVRSIGLWLGLVTVLLLTLQPGFAAADQQLPQGYTPGKVMLHTAEVCPAIFGKPEAKRDSRQLIQTKLDNVQGEDGNYTVFFHGHKWSTPARLQMRGLTLVGTRDTADERYAVFYLDPELAQTSACPNGFYKLHAGDSLFRKSFIVSIHDRVVLAESDKQLGYFQPRGYQDPFFRMIWRATWEIAWPVQSTSKGGGGGAKTPPRANNRRNNRPNNSKKK